MNTKQVIVIRKDLKMRRGKEIAQGAHASMAFITRKLTGADNMRTVEFKPAEIEWLNSSFRKITCKVDSEEALLAVYEKALEAGVTAKLITDSGATEFHGVATHTCVAIGPDYEDAIDAVTGDLELY